MSGSHLCIPRNETVQPHFFQNRIIMFCLLKFLHSVSDLYISRIGLSILFQPNLCGPILGIQYINRSQTHECGNWDGGRGIPRKGIHKWDFLAVPSYISPLPFFPLFPLLSSRFPTLPWVPSLYLRTASFSPLPTLHIFLSPFSFLSSLSFFPNTTLHLADLGILTKKDRKIIHFWIFWYYKYSAYALAYWFWRWIKFHHWPFPPPPLMVCMVRMVVCTVMVSRPNHATIAFLPCLINAFHPG